LYRLPVRVWQKVIRMTLLLPEKLQTTPANKQV
jgi:hypothetical protein